MKTTPHLWQPKVCPYCRAVFRIPKDTDSLGVRCPACQKKLRLYSTQVKTQQSRLKKGAKYFTTLGLLALPILLLLIIYSLSQKEKITSPLILARQTQQETKSVTPKQTNHPLQFQKSDSKLIQEIIPSIQSFLSASTPQELSALIDHPQESLPRIKNWHKHFPYKKESFHSITPQSQLLRQGDYIMLSILLESFDERPIVLHKTPDGYKVLWEAWVGYSHPSWTELLEKKTEQTIQVFVLCSKSNYYGYYFNDEEKWQAIKLSHPAFERPLYGYIPLEKLNQISSFLLNEGDTYIPFTLTIRYPQGENTSRNQVEILSIQASSWIPQPKKTTTP